ncbi:MAG: glucosamine-6-phosphate deaminase [Bacillota bacterium]
MDINVVDNYSELSEKAAAIVVNEVNCRPDTVLGLATGSTPEGMYAQLVKKYQERKVDFSDLITFNLDEYSGLSTEHPQSYHYYMHKHFFDHINIKSHNINIPHSEDRDIAHACGEYDRKIIEAGGINLQILGIGVNGHIGFNEPAEHLNTGTHLVDLSDETIAANSRFFNSRDDVPYQAITMGVGSIMHAEKILVMACGKNKARAIQLMCCGKVTTNLPASLLQLHRCVTLLLDREAASLLE